MSYIKGIKFIIIGIALSICLVLPGEIYQLYLEQFEDFHAISFYLDESDNAEDMNKAIYECSKNNEILVFKIVNEAKSSISTKINVYGDEKIKKYLKEEYSISEGKHSSFLMGESRVDFYGFVSAPVAIGAETKFSFVGSEENMKSFYVEISERYECTQPDYSGYESRSTYSNMIITAWTMLILLCCFMTVYDCAFQKKENFIRMSLGENIPLRIVKNIVVDTLFYVILSAVVLLLTMNISNVFFMFSVTVKGLVFAVLFNAVSYLNMIPRNVKTLTGKDKSSKKLLTTNYILKSVCIMLTCLVISTNIASVSECISYAKQRGFFENYSDYSWYSQINSSVTDSDKCESQFYFHFIDEMDIFYLCQWYSLSDSGKGVCEANRNTKDYLIKEIDVFDDLDFTKSAYILINKNENLSDNDLTELEQRASSWVDGDVEFCYYGKNAKIVARTYNSKPDTFWIKNPIIIFYNIDPVDNSAEAPDVSAFPLNFCMIKNDERQLAEFSEKYGMTCEKTNVLAYYEYKMTSLSRTLYLNLVLSAIIIFLEILVTATVVRLEYSVNASELAIKKVLGYSNTARFYQLYSISVSLWLISTVLSVVISNITNFGQPYYIVIGAVIILIFDLVIITLNTLKQDRQKIQKILKGGAL